MPRVLRIHNRLIIGGPTLNVLYLTKYLAPEFETLLITGEKDPHEKDASFLAEQMGIHTITIEGMGRSINPWKDYSAYRKIKSIIKDFKPDIVHTHAAKPGAVGRMAANSCDVPVVIHTYHGHVFHSYFNSLKTKFVINTERWLASKSDAIVAISAQQKKELSEDFKIDHQDKFRVIPLGFELGKFREDQKAKRKKFRDEFHLADDEIAIGIVGRLAPIKNHGLFLEGISHLINYSSKKIKAFIIGDGETRSEVEQKARQLQIEFSSNGSSAPLTFTSWRSDIDVINAGLDIITLTSLNEGTPVSLIEAQAANRPIVSTRVGGISDIVLENQTGLLSDVADVNGFKNNLLRMVEDDKLRINLGKHGAEHVMEKFSVQRLANDMAGLYWELLEKKSGRLLR